MRFEEVLPSLREGKKIRRTSWWEGHYFRLASNRIVDQGERNIVFGKDDLFCSDWEIVEEKKKVKLRDLTKEQYSSRLKKYCNLHCKYCRFEAVLCDYTYERCWFNHKEFYSDKFLDQEIEIEVED